MPNSFSPSMLRQRSSHPFLAKMAANRALNYAYVNSDIVRVYHKRQEHGEDLVALFTDIDKTFYRDDKQEAAKEITKRAQAKQWPIIAITGNSYERVLERIQQGELPYFQIIAGSVGTEIWVLHTQGQRKWYVKDEYFTTRMTKTKFVRSQLLPQAHAMVRSLRDKHPDWKLDFQEPVKEQDLLGNPDPSYQPFKISFCFFAAPDQASLAAVSKAARKFFPHHPVIVCEEINHNSTLPPDAPSKKYCLDIVASSKSGALKYIQKLFGIREGVVAGDSGNDVDMLLASNRLMSVMVGGHELTARFAIQEAQQLSQRGFLTLSYLLDKKIKHVHIDKSARRQAGESILNALRYFERKALWEQYVKVVLSFYQKLTLTKP